MSQIYSAIRKIHFAAFSAFHRRYLSSVAADVSLPAHSRKATDAGRDPDAFLLAAHLDTVRRDTNYSMLQASKGVTWVMVGAGLFGACLLVGGAGAEETPPPKQQSSVTTTVLNPLNSKEDKAKAIAGAGIDKASAWWSNRKKKKEGEEIK